MRDLIIYGGGGFGRETALLVHQINELRPSWNLIGFCDDGLRKGSLVDALNVIGGMSELNNLQGPVAVAIAVADPSRRRELRSKIKNPGIDFPVLLHPSVTVGDEQRNKIGEGSIVAARTILTTNVTVGSFVIINLACTVGHDVIIDDFSSLMPACSLSGSVTVKSEVLVGTGAIILQGLTVGDRSRIGAGSVVTRDVPADTTVVGIPARPVSKKLT